MHVYEDYLLLAIPVNPYLEQQQHAPASSRPLNFFHEYSFGPAGRPTASENTHSKAAYSPRFQMIVSGRDDKHV
jgi:hypothetical protein